MAGAVVRAGGVVPVQQAAHVGADTRERGESGEGVAHEADDGRGGEAPDTPQRKVSYGSDRHPGAGASGDKSAGWLLPERCWRSGAFKEDTGGQASSSGAEASPKEHAT